VAAHECSTIRRRMQSGLRQKALRGELHHGVPAGYVCVEGKHLRKHPDQRVQRAVQSVFDLFDRCASVYELLDRLWQRGVKLPAPGVTDAAAELRWVDPTYDRVLAMLTNPKYAGVYAYPLHRHVRETDADGNTRVRIAKVPAGQWDVELHDHHPAYIRWECYQRNQEKIAMNANRYAPQARGAALSGEGLLVGLIRCRRCNHQMAVQYRSSGAIVYRCQGGRRQREESKKGCFSFRANELEQQLVEQLLEAVAPAGVAAARRAAERLAARRELQRQRLQDALEHASYQADLARRRFEKVDPANRLVFDTLAEEWEGALRRLEEQKAKLVAFDRNEPPRPTAEEEALLNQLAQRLEAVWFDKRADGRLKKQIVRTLIEHVYAELDRERNEVVLYVHWSGGHVTELRQRHGRRRRSPGAKQLREVIDGLRRVADDGAIARILNRAGLRTEQAQSWTQRRVRAFRRRHGIAAFCPKQKEAAGWLSQAEAATRLGISPMSVHRLIESGLLTPEWYHPGLPTVLKASQLNSKAVQRAAKAIQNHTTAPLPSDPRQRTLFPDTE